MRIKPILFNTEMVKAILDGRKTVTRRVVKFNKGQNPEWTGYVPDGDVLYGSNNIPAAKAPFRKDDVLWVRETFVQPAKHTFWYKADSKVQNILWRPSIHMPRKAARIFLRVTGVKTERLKDITEEDAKAEGICGFFLGMGETGYSENPEAKTFYDGPVGAFANLWDSTIKPADLKNYGWNANPWVWVIEFARCEKPKEWENV